MKASVVWDIENCSYDPSSCRGTEFRIRGAVTLPDGVDNNNNLTLAAYVQVSVNAHSPRKASADDNRITGIEYNEIILPSPGSLYCNRSRNGQYFAKEGRYTLCAASLEGDQHEYMDRFSLYSHFGLHKAEIIP